MATRQSGEEQQRRYLCIHLYSAVGTRICECIYTHACVCVCVRWSGRSRRRCVSRSYGRSSNGCIYLSYVHVYVYGLHVFVYVYTHTCVCVMMAREKEAAARQSELRAEKQRRYLCIHLYSCLYKCVCMCIHTHVCVCVYTHIVCGGGGPGGGSA